MGRSAGEDTTEGTCVVVLGGVEGDGLALDLGGSLLSTYKSDDTSAKGSASPLRPSSPSCRPIKVRTGGDSGLSSLELVLGRL